MSREDLGVELVAVEGGRLDGGLEMAVGLILRGLAEGQIQFGVLPLVPFLANIRWP